MNQLLAVGQALSRPNAFIIQQIIIQRLLTTLPTEDNGLSSPLSASWHMWMPIASDVREEQLVTPLLSSGL
jgi:hypothetical protein